MCARWPLTCITTVLCANVSAVESADPVAAIRQAMRAADQARSEEANEAAHFATEKLRARAAIDLITERTQIEQTRVNELEAEIATIRAELATLTQTETAKPTWHTPLAIALDNSHQRLAALPPHLTGSLGERSSTQPLETTAQVVDALLDLDERLDQALASATSWTLAIEAGELDGEAHAVHLLRCGTIASWWVALDGHRAGSAAVIDGRLVLTDAQTDTERRQILEAVAIVRERAAPSLLRLTLIPVVHP